MFINSVHLTRSTRRPVPELRVNRQSLHAGPRARYCLSVYHNHIHCHPPSTIQNCRRLNPGAQMEEQAQTLLVTLRKSSVPVETKLAAFNNLKSSIKHLRVPEASQAAIFECIKVAIGAQTSP